jgi:hypothetical protein
MILSSLLAYLPQTLHFQNRKDDTSAKGGNREH